MVPVCYGEAETIARPSNGPSQTDIVVVKESVCRAGSCTRYCNRFLMSEICKQLYQRLPWPDDSTRVRRCGRELYVQQWRGSEGCFESRSRVEPGWWVPNPCETALTFVKQAVEVIRAGYSSAIDAQSRKYEAVVLGRWMFSTTGVSRRPASKLSLTFITACLGIELH